jgi:hypothetical protein
MEHSFYGVTSTVLVRGSVSLTRQSGQDTITPQVTPARYGLNSFTITARNALGRPISGVRGELELTMLDMDLGSQIIPIRHGDTAAQGTVSGRGSLSMPGRWQVVVYLTPPASEPRAQVTFHFAISDTGQ